MLLVKLDLINSTYKIIARFQKVAALKLVKLSIIASLWIKDLRATRCCPSPVCFCVTLISRSANSFQGYSNYDTTVEDYSSDIYPDYATFSWFPNVYYYNVPNLESLNH